MADKVVTMEEPAQKQTFFNPLPDFIQQKSVIHANQDKTIQRQHKDNEESSPPPPPVLKPMIYWDDGEKKNLIPPSVLETSAQEGSADGSSSDPISPGKFQLISPLTPNFREAGIDLIGKGILNPRHYIDDFGNQWQDTHQLVLDWRLGNIATNVLAKVPPWLRPDLEGLDMDTYLTNKLTLKALGSSNTRDNPEFNDGSGLIIPLYTKKITF